MCNKSSVMGLSILIMFMSLLMGSYFLLLHWDLMGFSAPHFFRRHAFYVNCDWTNTHVQYKIVITKELMYCQLSVGGNDSDGMSGGVNTRSASLAKKVSGLTLDVVEIKETIANLETSLQYALQRGLEKLFKGLAQPQRPLGSKIKVESETTPSSDLRQGIVKQWKVHRPIM